AVVIGKLRERDDERRLRDDTKLSVDLAGQRRERAPAVVQPRLGYDTLDILRELRVVPGSQLVEHRSRVEMRVPDVEVAHRRELPDRLAIGAGNREDGSGAGGAA